MLKTATGFKISLGYGVKDNLHPAGHKGVDSIGKGVVEKVVDYGDVNAGKTVIIQLEDGTRAVYGHISDWAVKTGEKVDTGQLLAYSGDTGRSTGPHLHYSLQDSNGAYINPEKTVDKALEQTGGSWLSDNPFTRAKAKVNEVQDSVAQLNHNIESFKDWIMYWGNPVNLGSEIWQGLSTLITAPGTAYFLMGFTAVGIMIWSLGANWPKKYVFWTWIVYWGFRLLIANTGGM